MNMTNDINEVHLTGTLDNEPKITTTKNGKRAFLRLATTEFPVDDEGSPKGRTNWHNIITFDEQLVTAIQSGVDHFAMGPGSRLEIKGRNKSGRYEVDGVVHYTYDVELVEFDIVRRDPQ